MKNINEAEDKKHYLKIKLFEDIQSISQKYPFIEMYFKDFNNLDNLNGKNLKIYINILYQRYKNYEKINYFEKVELIKTQYMRQKFKHEKHYNDKVLDLVLLKEIQAEKELKQNKSLKKLKSADPGKKGKNKLINNIKNESIQINANKINNYQPLKSFYIKNNLYNKNIKENNNNNINIVEKNKTSQIIEILNNGLLIWIDENYNNSENSSYLRLLKANKNLSVFCFDNVDEAFHEITLNHKFREIFILISGRLYPNLYIKLKDNINKITFLPIICIFTSFNLAKEIVINQNKYKEIKSLFYNKGGVKTNFIDCVKFFKEYNLFYKSNLKNIYNKEVNKSYDGCLTFEYIYSKNQLVLPFLYYETMESNINLISNSDIIIFEKFVQNTFKDEKIQKLILPMLYIKDFPREILSKFFTRMYTEQTSFFSELNKSLMKKESCFDIYVKTMYEGLYIGSLKHSNNEILYRGTRMKRSEIDDIRKSFEEWNKIGDKKLPNFLLYSRTFLSFTKVKEKIKYFIKQTNDSFYGIIFILKNNRNIMNKYSSNADIEYLSKYPNEKEVLFFPYTTFCLKNIYNQHYENQDCIFIELDYLGQYEYVLEQFKKDEQFQNDFINSLYYYEFNYNIEAINNSLFPSKDNIENFLKDNNLKIENNIKCLHQILLKIHEINKMLINDNKDRILMNNTNDAFSSSNIVYLKQIRKKNIKEQIPYQIIPKMDKTLYINENELLENNINDFNKEKIQKNLLKQSNSNSNEVEIIQVTLTATSGLKVVIPAPKNMPLSQLLKNYVHKIGIPDYMINTKIIFLFKAEILDPNSQRPISDYFKSFNCNIIVIDLENIIGAYCIHDNRKINGKNLYN